MWNNSVHRLLISLALVAAAFPSLTAAQGFDVGKLYAGAGLSQNRITGSMSGVGKSGAALGVQAFAGYQFAEVIPKLHIDGEVGYLDSGDMKTDVTACGPIVGCVTTTVKTRAKGPWVTGVVRYMISPNILAIGRAGHDFGDDNGFMFGAGIGFILTRKLTARLEFVERQNTQSLQANAVLRF